MLSELMFNYFILRDYLMKIAIDIGSSKTPLVNKTFGITGYELNTRLVDLLKTDLDGCEVVVLSSTSEQHLTDLIRETKPNKCISIGYASYNEQVSGTETFLSTTAGGSKLGTQLHENITNVLGLRDRGIIKLENQYKVPYAQVNLGLIDHDVDVMIIESNLSKLSKAIAEAIL